MANKRVGKYGDYYGSFTSESEYLSDTAKETNSEYIYRYLSSEGWSFNAICAILGNMEQESTLNPGCWQSHNIDGESSGYGLVQWTPSTKYINWCKLNGYTDYSTMDSNLARLMYDLDNGGQWYGTSEYPMSFHTFTTSKEPVDYLTRAFCACYERPGVPEIEKRLSYASKWVTHLNETLHSASSNSTSSITLTEEQAINRIVACAKAQLKSGYYATGNSSAGTLKSWYAQKMWEENPHFYNGNKNGYDWCTVFVDWCFIECFGADNTRAMTGEKVEGVGASATHSFQYFINKGSKYYSRSEPRVGAQIFFDWDGAHKDDTTNIANHTGIVIAYDESTGLVTTVEGNMSYNDHGSAVGTRTFNKDSYRFVRGYGYPDWSVVLNYTPTTTIFRTPNETVPAPEIPIIPEPPVVSKYGVRIKGKLYVPYISNGKRWIKATPHVSDGKNWRRTN